MKLAVRLLLLAVLASATAGVVALAAPGGRTARTSAASCTSSLPPGTHRLRLRIAGHMRTAWIHTPAGLTGRLPLLLALHGYGGNGRQMEHYAGFSELADRSGFLVAYPSSAGIDWNSRDDRRGPADLVFLGRLITRLVATACADPRRVFAAGVSNGGSMVALAGCRLRGLTAIATVAGEYFDWRCRPSRPLSVLEVHGTADPVVPYRGQRGAISVPAYVSGWVRRDRCAPAPVRRALAPRTTLLRWRGCAGGVRVEQIRIARGRHQWPDATPPDPGPPATICASCVIWRFFRSA